MDPQASLAPRVLERSAASTTEAWPMAIPRVAAQAWAADSTAGDFMEVATGNSRSR